MQEMPLLSSLLLAPIGTYKKVCAFYKHGDDIVNKHKQIRSIKVRFLL